MSDAPPNNFFRCTEQLTSQIAKSTEGRNLRSLGGHRHRYHNASGNRPARSDTHSILGRRCPPRELSPVTLRSGFCRCSAWPWFVPSPKLTGTVNPSQDAVLRPTLMPRANLAQPSKTETRLKFNHTPGEAVGRAAETARVSDVGRCGGRDQGCEVEDVENIEEICPDCEF